MQKHYFYKPYFLAILIGVFVSISVPVKAHEVNETTAQVILRDGQVEVSIVTDKVRLITALQNNLAWLMGDIDEVMPADFSVDQQEGFIRALFMKTASLFVNQKTIMFERVVFKKQSHEHIINIVLQARHSFSNVENIALSLPKSLGSVHASFVKPQYKVLEAGGTAHIAF